MQRGDHVSGHRERTGNPALPDIFHARGDLLSHSLVHQHLGRQHDLAFVQLGFEVVARSQPQLLVEDLRDDDLAAGAEFDRVNRYGLVVLWFHIIVF